MAAVTKNKLSVLIDGVERRAEVTECKITNNDRDSTELSFSEAEIGKLKDWFLEGVAFQDPSDADSVWSLIFDSPGTEVAVIYNPYKSVAAGPTTPWYTGTVTVTDDDFELGGESDVSTTARRTTPFKFKFLAKPVKDVSP